MGRGPRDSVALTAQPRLRDLPSEALPETNPDQDWFQPDPSIIAEAKQIARELDCDEIIAMRLVMLGRSPQEITDYLNPSPQHIRSPEETVEGMTACAKALREGIASGDGVAVFGDYDVDGQTSRSILLKSLDGAHVHSGSANAATGFGLTREFVEEAAENDCRWLITVDCGSTQSEPIRLAQSLGMKVIVIDHHDADSANPADWHLNPRLAAAEAMSEIVAAAEAGGVRQDLSENPPWPIQLDKLTPRSRKILEEQLGKENFSELEKAIVENSDPNNTGSMLTWKFAAAMQMDENGSVSPEHYGRSLYLAGLGAVADLAPCNDEEVRAFVRVPCDGDKQAEFFGNKDVIPPGIRLLAEAFDEDPARPDELTRTRALLNLSKRSVEIDPEDILQIISADKPDKKTRALARKLTDDYERLSSIRRDEMDPQVKKQVKTDQGHCSFAVLRGFEDHAGYSRMCANTAVKETGKPAFVFVRKTKKDEFGQELYKFSGANGVVPGVELGDLISDRRLRSACKIKTRDWLSKETELVNLGGHAAVVSGVCTREQIPKVQAAIEAWATRHEKSWSPIEARRPRLARRLVTPSRLRRLERESGMLAPYSFPQSPAIQVSANGKFSELRAEDDGYGATFTLDDGSDRRVMLSPEIAAMVRDNRRRSFEAVLPLGRAGKYYISKIVGS